MLQFLGGVSLAAIAFAGSCGSCQQTTAQALDRVCDPGATECISLGAFQHNIDSALQGKVVGYVSIVGGLPQPVTYGNARLSADGVEPWTVDVAINDMSLTKVFTTIAVLQVLDKHHLDLGTKIAQFLPPDWTQGSGISDITVQDLLTHRSGFRDGPSGDTSYANLKKQIADGVTAADRATASYNNLNFALFRVILPAIDGVPDPGAVTRDHDTSAWYVAYVREHVFKPVGDTEVDCKPVGPHPGMWYPASPAATLHGNDGGDWTGLCGGGGWNLSAGAVYRLLLSLATDERVLTTAQKTLMNTSCLGWDCSVWAQDDYVGKRGDWQDGQHGEVHTFMGLFHQNKITVVLIVNSPMPVDSETLVKSAYANARVPR